MLSLLKYLKSCFYRFSHVIHIHSRLESCDDLSLSVDKELGGIPLDIGFLAECFVIHVRELFQHLILHAFTESFKRLLRGKKSKQRICGLTVDIDLGKLRELGAELQSTELMDLLIVSRSLVCELVAGKSRISKS